MVSYFYAVVVRGIPDGQATVDDVDRDFWRLLVNLKHGMYQGYGGLCIISGVQSQL